MAIEHPHDDRIQEYLDGVLAPPEHAAVGEHFDTCARCRRSLEQYRALYHVLAEEPIVGLSDGFADIVMQRVIEPRSIRFSPIWLWPAVAAAVLLAIHLWLADLGPVWTGVAGMFVAQAQSLSGLLHKWVSVVDDYGQSGKLLIGAALALAMVAGLDRLTRAIRHGRLLMLS